MPAVVVTGIGGNVGQGVLRVLRAVEPDLRLVGTNTEAVSGGNHLCDRVYKLPFAWEHGYLDQMADICRTEDVALVIPATDFEAYHLGVGRDVLPTLAASSPDVTGMFLDKHDTAERFLERGIPFAPTSLPSAYDGAFASTVVKPRKGRGSRDVHIDRPSPERFPDTFVVQERIVGQEVTCAFYVRRDGELHGLVVFERALENGTTMVCTVARDREGALAEVVRAMMDAFQIVGPCNVQAIVDHDGVVVPFEVNCRFSGTASIRHHLGFPDVAFAVDEFLHGVDPRPAAVVAGSAVRILHDVIYPGASLEDVAGGSPAALVF